jgi:IS30 family transposase
MGKKYSQLTREQRYQIAVLLDAEKKPSKIASILKMDRSTIYREIARNSTKGGRYSAGWANKAHIFRQWSHYSLTNHKKIKGWLERHICEKLYLRWSPEQISGRLKRERGISISHVAIYKYVAWDQGMSGSLHKYLRQYGHRRKAYKRPRKMPENWCKRVPMTKRPKSANERSRLGHWERDLVVSAKNKPGALLTIVDRKSRYTLMRKTPSKRSDDVYRATMAALSSRNVPCATITNDNGLEFQDHTKVTAEHGIPVFFTRAYCSWEKGTNENTNGLIRQFFPKKTVFNDFDDQSFIMVQNLLNLRPRKTLGYKTPFEVQFKKRFELFRKRISLYTRSV